MDWEASELAARTRSLGAIAAGIAAAQAEARAVTEAAALGLARTMLAMLAGMLPDLCARHGGQEVQALLRQVLPLLSPQDRIVVRVAPAVIGAIRADVALLEEELAAAVVLTPAALLPGDARVTWTDGAMVRDQAAMLAAIAAALAGLGLMEPLTTWSMADAE